MAEGGDLPSIKDGSDADFDFICTPCGEDNIREEVVKYCPECQEYLCKTCTKHHGRLKATRAHKLLDKDDAKQSSVIAKTKCRYHPGRDIEMYCEGHDMVYCVMCIATEHRSCVGVNRIEDVSKSSADATDIQHVSDETKSVQEQIQALKISREKNLTFLEEQRNVIQERLEEDERRLVEHIRKLKRDTSESLDKGYTKLKEELEIEIDESIDIIHNLDETLKQLQSVADLDASQQFVQMKLVKMNVAEAKTLHADGVSNSTKSIRYTENTDLVNSVMTSVALGQVHEKNPSTSTQYKMKSKKEISVKMSKDINKCYISDMCQLQDGTIMLGDYNNRKVKMLNNNYNVKDHCDLDAKPTGICCIGKNEIAVKMSSNKIQFIFVDSVLHKTRCLENIFSGAQFGLICYVEKLCVSRGNGVNMYTREGLFQTCIDKDQNEKSIFKSATQHMAVSGDILIVTDSTDGAVCLNKEGTVRRELRDTRLKNTRGVCVSDDGTVFLCGYNSNNIVMFSSDGRCIGELVAVDAGLKSPVSLCYDSIKHSIIVACSTSNTISIVELTGK